MVITGHEAEKVKFEAVSAGVRAIHNAQYASGEMLSSLQTAVHHLPELTTAVLVMLADQPMVEPEIIDQLLFAYWQGDGDLIAPTYAGRRGNPVLINRRYFPDLLALPNSAAPRDLLRQHQDKLHLLPVDSNSILHDIDDPQDYGRWQPKNV